MVMNKITHYFITLSRYFQLNNETWFENKEKYMPMKYKYLCCSLKHTLCLYECLYLEKSMHYRIIICIV